MKYKNVSKEELIERIEEATDELTEVLADFDLSDHDLLEIRDKLENRVRTSQEILLGYKEV